MPHLVFISWIVLTNKFTHSPHLVMGLVPPPGDFEYRVPLVEGGLHGLLHHPQHGGQPLALGLPAGYLHFRLLKPGQRLGENIIGVLVTYYYYYLYLYLLLVYLLLIIIITYTYFWCTYW